LESEAQAVEGRLQSIGVMAPPVSLTRMSMRPSSFCDPLDRVRRLFLLRKVGLDTDPH